jgi:hypothetical protein
MGSRQVLIPLFFGVDPQQKLSVPEISAGGGSLLTFWRELGRDKSSDYSAEQLILLDLSNVKRFFSCLFLKCRFGT